MMLSGCFIVAVVHSGRHSLPARLRTLSLAIATEDRYRRLIVPHGVPTADVFPAEQHLRMASFVES